MVAVSLDRIPYERITTEARQARFGRVVLTVLAAVLYGVGWVAGKVLGALWLVLAWSLTAVKVGWTDTRGGSSPPRPR